MSLHITTAVAASLALTSGLVAAEPPRPQLDHEEIPQGFGPDGLEDAYFGPGVIVEELDRAVAAGLIPDRAMQPMPQVQRLPDASPRAGIVTRDDIFLFEDTTDILATGFSLGELFDLMTQASNEIMLNHGDNYDFVAFWTNFDVDPASQLGSAFYAGIENDVTGIGQGLFNERAVSGIAGDTIQGWVMMYNVNDWSSFGNLTTQLVFGQEFEHRFGMFLAPLPDGRPLQGDNSVCGRGAHWNWKVDGQGSGMEIREWIGSSPAVLGGDCSQSGFPFICNNTDIGGVFSWADLYLMGYATADEIDANGTDLRYMDSSDCSPSYNGSISTFTMNDIVTSNGPRVPDANSAQQDFRTAWVMFHRPASLPSDSDLDRAVDFLNGWTDEWALGTAGRGTMDNTLVKAFRLVLPSGTPDLITPDIATTFTVQAVDVLDPPDVASGLLHVSTDGGSIVTSPLVSLGGDLFEATIPATACGSKVSYFVTIDTVSGVTVKTRSFTSISAFGIDIIVDNPVELADGFVVNPDGDDTATTGQWTHGDPNGTGAQPEDDHTEAGINCYFTGQGTVGGRIGDNDIDSGDTSLLSPVMDATGLAEPVLSYYRWYSNTAGNDPGNDIFVIDISTDGGSTWSSLETVGPTGTGTSGGWVLAEFDLVALGIAPTSQMRLRFNASDLASGSIVEAAVDDIRISALNCAACPADMNGDGVLDVFDVFAFLADYDDGACTGPNGDFNGDGTCNAFDVFEFLGAYDNGAGCP